MMDLSQFSTDDLKALRDGDLSRVSTEGLKKLRSMREPAKEAKPDLWEGVEGAWWKKPAAQLGSGFMDLAMGVGQLAGVVDRADIDEKRRIDAELNKDTTGKVLNFAGNVLPTFALPAGALARGAGAALKGVGAIGAPAAARMGGSTALDMILTGMALGASAPVGEQDSRAQNMAVAGLASAALPVAGAAYRGVKSAFQPFTAKGQQEGAARMLAGAIDDPATAAAVLAKPRMIVPGSPITTPEALGSTPLARLTNTLAQKSGPLQDDLRLLAAEQNAARWNYMAPEIGTSGTVKGLETARREATEEIYDRAFRQKLKKESIKAVERLEGRPAFDYAARQAMEDLKNLYGNVPEDAVTGSVRGLHQVKVVLDRMLDGLKNKTLSADKFDKAGITGIRANVLDELKKVKQYAKASEKFAYMSRPIDRQKLLQEMFGRQYANAPDVLGNPMMSAPKLRQAINSNSDDVKGVLNLGQQTMLDDVLRDIDRSNIFSKAGQMRVGNSTTAEKLGTAEDVARIARSTLGFTGAVGGLLGNTLSKTSEKAVQKMEAMVMSGLLDPATARTMLISQLPKAEAQRALLDFNAKLMLSETVKNAALRSPALGLLYAD